MATTVFYNGIEITGESFDVDIRVGRSRELDDFQAVAGSVKVRNFDRNFDPPFFTTPTYLLMESGDFLLLESGDKILLEQGSQASGSYGVIEIGGTFVVKDGAVTVFTGHVEDVVYSYRVDGRTEAEFILGDALTTLASSQFQTEWETTDNQLSGDRIEDALTRDGVGLENSIGTFNPGTIHLQGDVVSVGSGVLDYIRTIARTEHGKFWVDTATQLQFRDRYTFPSLTPVAEFDDMGTNFGFGDVSVRFGSELRAWRATVTRLGGLPQTAVATAPPPDTIGARGVSVDGLLFRGDMYSQSLANFLANKFSDPEALISSIEVFMHGLGVTPRATIAGIQINDTVTQTWTPTGSGVQINQTLVVDGMHYRADQTKWASMTLQLSAYPDTNYFTWDVDSFDTGVRYGF